MTNPGQTLGRYELIARIGEGGMAEVHLARQRGPRAFEKLVVVKTVHPRLAEKPALAEALLEEARIAAKVRHPHVVDIYDLGEEAGTYFIAMEYLEGESMTAVIRAQRAKGGARLSPLRTAQVVADCAGGLHAAHELRSLSGEPLELVHQDVTPGNVFVLYTGQAKLLDFGVAKVRSSEDASLVKGKAGYLAPELFDKRVADRRSDVFALGVVLWESLTLRRLFAGATDADTFAKIRACQVPAPSTLVPGVPPELDRVCARALTRSPDDRYPTAKAMQEDLIAFLRGAERHDYDSMATWMRATFASQINARMQLLRELDQGGVPAADTLEALTATFDDRSPATPEPGVDLPPLAGPAVGPAGPVVIPAVIPAVAPVLPAIGAKPAGKRLLPLPAPRLGALPTLTGRASTAPVVAAASDVASAPMAVVAAVASAPVAGAAASDVASAPGAVVAAVASAPVAAASSSAPGGAAAAASSAPIAVAASRAPAGAAVAVVAAPVSAADDEIVEPSGVVDLPSGVVELPLKPPPVPRRPHTESSASGEVAPAEAPADASVPTDLPPDDADGLDEPMPSSAPSRRFWIGAGVGAVALVALVVVLMSGSGKARSAAGGAELERAIDAAAPTPVDVALASPDAAVAVALVEPVDAGVSDAALRVDARPPSVDARPPSGGSATVGPPPVAPDPAKAAALAQAGLQKVMSGDTRGAIASFQAALRADHGHAPAQRGLGLAYEKQGDKARAARAFREYLRLAPNARDAAQIRARLEKLK
ncbi:MAG: protein kinase [Myxococcales bacterium]|nr:protein kinase [Myxococcales bacterium]